MSFYSNNSNRPTGGIKLVSIVFWGGVALFTLGMIVRPHSISAELQKQEAKGVRTAAVSTSSADSTNNSGTNSLPSSGNGTALAENNDAVYAATLNDVSSRVISELDSYAQQDYQQHVDDTWDTSEHHDGMTLMGEHFLAKASDNADCENMLILCYRLHYSNDEGSEATYYRYAMVTDVTIDSDLDTAVDMDSFYAPDGDSDSNLAFHVWDGYYVIGYQTYEALSGDIYYTCGDDYVDYNNIDEDAAIAYDKSTTNHISETEEAEAEEPTPEPTKTPEEDTATHRYEVVLEQCSWTQAQQKAKDRGGYLVNINTEAEYNEILKLLNSNGDYQGPQLYIGARRGDTDHDYKWTRADGSTYGDVINSDSYWVHRFWQSINGNTEPSFGYDGVEENRLAIYLDRSKSAWVFNDIPDDSPSVAPEIHYGYIIEYNN